MPVDINGYTLNKTNNQLVFAASSSVDPGNNGLMISLLPAMAGSATGNGTYKCYPFPINDVNLNVWTVWSTSTYRFTAPVSGIYYVSYSGIVGNGTMTQMNGYNGIIVNGALQYWSYKDTISIWELQHIHLAFKLSAGDWLAWAFNTSPSYDSGNAAGAYQSNHNESTIWLIG